MHGKHGSTAADDRLHKSATHSAPEQPLFDYRGAIETVMTSVALTAMPAVGFIAAEREQAPAKPNAKPLPKVFEGSGFFIDNKGDMATAAHVIWDSNKIIVVTTDGQPHPAKIVKMDAAHDVAELQVSGVAPNQPYLELGDSRHLYPGQTVTAMGHPGGTPQITIARGEYLGSVPVSHFFEGNPNAFHKQMVAGGLTPAAEKQFWKQPVMEGTAVLSGGGSGGPVVDDSGKAVGIVSLGSLAGIGAYQSIETLKNMLKYPSPYNMIYRPKCLTDLQYYASRMFGLKCEKDTRVPTLDHIETRDGKPILPFSYTQIFE